MDNTFLSICCDCKKGFTGYVGSRYGVAEGPICEPCLKLRYAKEEEKQMKKELRELYHGPKREPRGNANRFRKLIRR
jgi:hypothetical protein